MSGSPQNGEVRVDMRSDTVTKPTPGMLEAMLTAEVGDDVFGDDPTVKLLQEEVAARLGKAAALYVPSGTMSNQLALKSQTSPGDQVVLEDGAHIYRYEGGGPGMLSGTRSATTRWITWLARDSSAAAARASVATSVAQYTR